VSNTSRAGLAVAGLSLGTSLNPLNSSMFVAVSCALAPFRPTSCSSASPARVWRWGRRRRTRAPSSWSVFWPGRTTRRPPGRWALWLLTASFAVLLVLALTALMGVPYGSVSIASNQGLYLSAAPQDRGVAAGIFQTCRYVGAISATVMIGIFYGNGVNQENGAAWCWSCRVPVR
jgi:hypothetical protein